MCGRDARLGVLDRARGAERAKDAIQSLSIRVAHPKVNVGSLSVGNQQKVLLSRAVVDRAKGCKAVLAKKSGIKILSDDQDAKGSREGGMNAMLGYVTRFPKIDAVFTINDPQAVGSDLAATQLQRKNIVITCVEGAPDIETALETDTPVQVSASQDPWAMAQTAVPRHATRVGLGATYCGTPALQR